jgi:hypothetical protein
LAHLVTRQLTGYREAAGCPGLTHCRGRYRPRLRSVRRAAGEHVRPRPGLSTGASRRNRLGRNDLCHAGRRVSVVVETLSFRTRKVVVALPDLPEMAAAASQEAIAAAAFSHSPHHRLSFGWQAPRNCQLP